MSDNLFKAIQLPNNTVKWYKYGIYPVIGTQTATTASWTGEIDVPELYDGLTIAYYLPRTSAAGVTLNLTLSDGTTTGPIEVYQTAITRMSTHYGSGSTIVLTYWSAGSISINGVATTTARWTHCDYALAAVTQTATATNAEYEVLFSNTADNTTRTEAARKDTGLKFNPSTDNLTVGSSVTIGSCKQIYNSTTESLDFVFV